MYTGTHTHTHTPLIIVWTIKDPVFLEEVHGSSLLHLSVTSNKARSFIAAGIS